MVDKKQILDLVMTYFGYDADGAVKFSVSDSGLVNVYEVEPNRGLLRTNLNQNFPRGELPFEFGEFHASLLWKGSKLQSLKGFPKRIAGSFMCRNCNWNNFVHGPQQVDGLFSVYQTKKLKNLDGFPDRVGGFANLPYHKDLPLLRLLNCQKGVLLRSDDTFTKPIVDIIEKYIQAHEQGQSAVIACAAELAAAGFKGNARW